MADITAAAVKALRERTDLPMMDCKRALVEANGDEEAAVDILKSKVGKVMDKRKDNVTSEGRFCTAVSEDGSATTMVELMCESAPVAKNDEFLFLGEQCAKQLLTGPGASNAEELLEQPCPDRAGMTLKNLHEDVVGKIREKIVVGRVTKVGGSVGVYVHHDGKTGVLFQASGDGGAEVLRGVAMHVAAMKPQVTHVAELDPAIVEEEKTKLSEAAKQTGKPENIIEKIVAGQLKNFYKESVLVEQQFVLDDKKTVGEALKAQGLEAVGFTLWRLGQS